MKKIYYCGYLDANCDKLKELQEALNELMEHKDAEFDKCIKLQEENKQLKEKLRIDIQMTADLGVVKDAMNLKEENKQLKEKLDNCIINSSNVYKQQKADFIEELKGKVNGFKLHIGNLNGIIKRLEENEEIILEELNKQKADFIKKLKWLSGLPVPRKDIDKLIKELENE